VYYSYTKLINMKEESKIRVDSCLLFMTHN